MRKEADMNAFCENKVMYVLNICVMNCWENVKLRSWYEYV